MSQRAIWIGTACAFVLLCGIGVGATVFREWTWTTGRLRADVESTVRAMRVHAEQGVVYARTALERAAQTLVEMDRNDTAAADALRARLEDMVVANPAMGTIWVVDGDGESWLDNQSISPAPGNVAHRSYFAAHRAPDAPVFYIGPTELGTLRRRPRFTLSHAARAPDGTLKAVITAGVDVSYFSEVYDRIRNQPGLTLLALTTRGDVLATSGELPEPDLERLTRVALQRTTTEGAIEIDGRWLLAAGRVGQLPLVVAVIGDERVLDAGWRERSIVLGLLAAAMTAGFIGLCALGLRSVGREARARAALRDSIRNLEREVAARTADLADAAVRARLIADSVPAAIAYVDSNLRYAFVNEGYRTVMGREPDAVIGKRLEEVMSPHAMTEAQSAIDRVLRGEPSKLEVRRDLPHGTRHLSISYTPHRTASGDVSGFYSMIIDTTEHKDSEARLQLLIAELNHRVRNVLAVAQSLVNQTLRAGRPLEECREVLHGRFAALAQAVEVLTSSDWRSADLRALATGSLAAVIDRVTMEGPQVAIEPRSAQLMALLFYELAANASKHGALAAAGGSVALSWTVTPGRRLSLTWRETGGPVVSLGSRRGFGGALLDQIVPHELGGTSSRRFEANGLVYDLDVPLNGGVAQDTPAPASQLRSGA